ncbi:hypothetical protein FI667_g14426, partial [Globisporangium splendens]
MPLLTTLRAKPPTAHRANKGNCILSLDRGRADSRVFMRYREFLKLPEEQQQRVHALADALMTSNALIPQKSSGTAAFRAFALDVPKKQLAEMILDNSAVPAPEEEMRVARGSTDAERLLGADERRRGEREESEQVCCKCCVHVDKRHRTRSC